MPPIDYDVPIDKASLTSLQAHGIAEYLRQQTDLSDVRIVIRDGNYVAARFVVDGLIGEVEIHGLEDEAFGESEE